MTNELLFEFALTSFNNCKNQMFKGADANPQLLAWHRGQLEAYLTVIDAMELTADYVVWFDAHYKAED